MNVLWVAYAVAVALVLGVAAHGAERALRLGGRSGRWPWAAALAGSWVLPLWALLRAPAAPQAAPVALVVTELRATGAAVVQGPEPWSAAWLVDAGAALLAGAGGVVDAATGAAAAALTPDPATLAATAPWVALLWALSAGVALLVVGTGLVRLLRASRRWPEANVLDEQVRISPSFGPALLGLARPRIVLPRWALALGEAPLRLVLAHEREHRSARDTLLLGAGALAVLAAPWNLPLWWQLRRLRLAVEVDCDLRVLRRGVPAREYGSLLVHVGERVGRVGLPAAALAEQPSYLERRLRMITERRPRGRAWRIVGATSLAGVMVALACETPAPMDPAGPSPTGRATATVSEMPEADTRTDAGADTLWTATEVRMDSVWTVTRDEAATFRVREVDFGDDPLFVVDGVVVDDLSVDDLVTEGVTKQRVRIDGIGTVDVARIEVVKGEAARAIYGERARNGVVIVTTEAADTAGTRPSGAVFRAREVTPTEAGPEAVGGEVATFRVREVGPPDPLIVVDGVVTELGVADVSALDVERIEVVKGAAARELYGERAAGGVIQITSRDGPSERAVLRERRDEPWTHAGATAGVVRASEAEPVVFVDGERFEGSWREARELAVESIEILEDGSADAFLRGRGLAPEGKPVILIRTRR